MHPTFVQLDQQKGVPALPESDEENFPLSKWYQSVHETPLDRLSPQDLARACRHDIHRAAVVPVALEILEDNIAESGMYNGELLTSLIDIPRVFCIKHDSLLQPLKLMIQNGRDAISPDVLVMAREFLVKVSR
jgi:hypothetical protein